MSQDLRRYIRHHVVTEARALRRKDGHLGMGSLPTLRDYIRHVRKQLRGAMRAVLRARRFKLPTDGVTGR